MVLFLWIHGNPTGFLPAVLYLRCKTRRFPCGEHKGTRDNETGRNNVKQRGTGDDGNVGHWKITDRSEDSWLWSGFIGKSDGGGITFYGGGRM